MIYKRKDSKVYWCRFTLNGKQYRMSTGLTVEREAERYEREQIAELKGQINKEKLFEKIRQKEQGTITSEEMLEAYLQGKKVGKTYTNRIKVMWRAWSEFAGDNVATATTEQAKKYVQKLIDSKISVTTINNNITLICGVYNNTLDTKRIIENPWKTVKKLKSDKVEREAFTELELASFGENQDEFCFPIVVFGISTGLRLGDMVHLKWSDIKGNMLVVKQRKTKQTIQIPIIPTLATFIRAIERADEYILPEHRAMYDKSQPNLSKKFKQYLQKCGVTGATVAVEGRKYKSSVKDIHSLRHTFAYIASKNQIPFPIVQSILGHMTPAMTRHYSDHANAEDKTRYLNQMPNVLELPVTGNKRISRAERARRILSRTTADNLERTKARLERILAIV